jgi:hypothetical protein
LAKDLSRWKTTLVRWQRTVALGSSTLCHRSEDLFSLAADLCSWSGDVPLRAASVGSMSKVLFVLTNGLWLESKILFLPTRGLWLESRGLRLGSKVLFIEPEDLLRNATGHSRTTKRSEVKNFGPPIYSSVESATSFDGGGRSSDRDGVPASHPERRTLSIRRLRRLPLLGKQCQRLRKRPRNVSMTTGHRAIAERLARGGATDPFASASSSRAL